jgi:glycosyltransferase involved in cell wall biosynthesis
MQQAPKLSEKPPGVNQPSAENASSLSQSHRVQTILEDRDRSVSDLQQQTDQCSAQKTDLLSQSAQLQTTLENSGRSLPAHQKALGDLTETLTRIYTSRACKALSFHYRVHYRGLPPETEWDRFAQPHLHAVKGSRVDLSRKETAKDPSQTTRTIARKVYFRLVRPLEAAVKPILKRTLGKNQRLWLWLKQARYRLAYGYHRAAVANIDKTSVHNAAGVKPFGINVAGYFRSEKGVGEAGRAAVRAIEGAAIPYVLNDIIDSGSINADSVPGELSDDNPYSVNLIHVNADQVPMFAVQKGDSYFRGRYNIGCWFWELSDFPKEWCPSFEYFDELWASTRFIHDALFRVSPIPIVRMPLPLCSEIELVPGMTRVDLRLPDDKFLFLSIFDLASFPARKNPLGLIKAFKLAFGGSDDAILLLKVAHSKQYPAELESLRRACANSAIRIVDKIFSRNQLNTLLSFADCYVSLHRSEGLGLTIAEAMKVGKPAIVTAYSGNMDFTTPANSFLVKYNLTEVDRDYGPYRKGRIWAEPDIEHAAELMRYVYQHPSTAAQIGQRAKLEMAELFSRRKICEQIRARLRLLASTGKMVLPESSRHVLFEEI